jgi:glycosyltransferase involved in cell wall biosynthesis
MRIIQITSGTGSFHCGTCMRDNALVVELRKQGHDALMVPLYLPPVLDEATAGEAPLFYGGINVYLQQKSGLFRHTPRWLDRLLDGPGVLRAAASRASMTRPSDLGELTLSMLRGEEGRQVKELERLTEWLEAEGRPEVVCLSNALLIGLARRIKQQTGAAVACMMQGEDSYLDSLPEPERQQAWDLLSQRADDVDLFLPVSRYYGDLMRARAGIPADRMRVVYPGLRLEGFEPAPAAPEPPVLGYLARMCPVKGLETLVEAYVLLRAGGRMPHLKLRIAGARTAADEPFVERLRARLDAKGLAGDVEFLPNVDRDEKIAFLQSLSVLSVPATYGESFGLYLIEAMAAGVPVVQPRHAAFPEIIEETGGGVLCEPDDPQALAAAVEGLLLDPSLARSLGEKGCRAVRERFSVEQMARETLRAFAAVTRRGETAAARG